MNKHKTSSELKSLAKGQLLGKYGTLIGAMMTHGGIIFLAEMAASYVFSFSGIISTILYFVVSFIISLIGGIFYASSCLMYLKNSCNYKITANEIFYGFKHVPDQIIKIQFFLAILSTLCQLPSNIVLFQYQTTGRLNLYMSALVLSFIGSFAYLLIQLPFSQVFYLMHDFPNLTVKEIYQKSIEIMRGHMGRLLYIEISFFPLAVLAILSCGLGLLWLYPYMQATRANFYLDLMANRNKTIN